MNTSEKPWPLLTSTFPPQKTSHLLRTYTPLSFALGRPTMATLLRWRSASWPCVRRSSPPGRSRWPQPRRRLAPRPGRPGSGGGQRSRGGRAGEAGEAVVWRFSRVANCKRGWVGHCFGNLKRELEFDEQCELKHDGKEDLSCVVSWSQIVQVIAHLARQINGVFLRLRETPILRS